MKNWHHANLIIGKTDSKNFVAKILKKDFNFDVLKNPDYYTFETENFGIDDARHFEKWSIGKPLIGDTKVSLLISETITIEAQNALLKILEEPKEGNFTFINIFDSGNFLPTFLSRVRIINYMSGEYSDSNISQNHNDPGILEAQKFIDANIGRRLAIVKSLNKKEIKPKNKELITNIIKVIYNKNYKITKEEIFRLNKIMKAEKYIKIRGSSNKIITEWLASVL
jgi:hypothetical protein